MLPEEPISLCSVRAWATYAKNLDTTPLVQKHLRDTLKSWVESQDIPNPLALPWIRILADGDLAFLEQHFEGLESAMGESNLSRLIADLLRKKGSVLDIRRDISSLYGEIMAFRRLKEMGAEEIEKITTRGDWHADGFTISVKTILDIDHNYRQIEQSVEGLAYLTECPAVQCLRYFRVARGKGLDNEFMRKILSFIDLQLEDVLQFLAFKIGFPEWRFSSIEIEAIRIPEVARSKETGRLHVKASRYDQKKLQFAFEDIRAGELPNSPGHGIKFGMELREKDSRAFTTNNDLNVWWGMPEVDRERLGKQISNKLREVADKNQGRDVSDFAAWINIEMHPSLQPGIANQPGKIRAFLAELIGEPRFPVLVHIYGGFELAKPLLVKLGPLMGFLARENEDEHGTKCS